MTGLEITELLDNLGEFIGSIAVVVTLFYLALQVRHGKEATEANTRALDENRRLALAQTYQARAATFIDQLNTQATSDAINEVWTKARLEGVDSLDAEERSRYGAVMWGTMTRFDAVHFAYQQGFVDDEYFAGFQQGIRNMAPHWRALNVVEGRKSFTAFVDEILAAQERAERGSNSL